MFDRVVVAERERRWHASGEVNYAGACVAHIAYFFVFMRIGVMELAKFNGFSVVIWLVAIVLHRRGWMRLAMGLAMAELIAHALVSSAVLGWQSGCGVFLIAIPVYTRTLPVARWLMVSAWPATALTIAAALAFIPPDTGRVAHPVLVLLGVANSLTFVGLLIISLLAIELTAARLEAELARAHEVSERLLMNTLPPPIAARLKGGDVVIADAFDMVSVVFCDIVGFTSYAATVTPARLVEVLNVVFRRFDDLAAQHGLEKIKTIGDAYMVAAGVPTSVADHALRAARMALGIRDALVGLNAELGTQLQVRIGIHSGPVVAGVIGKHKFSYDLWGDTVNTASRMESHGLVGEIQISERTRELLGNACETRERGVIELKGKGPTRVWLLDGLHDR